MVMILKIFAGFLSGIVSGMGIGGGVILIPVLTLFLGVEQKAAQGINLLYFIPTGAVALWVHLKNQNIDLKAAWSIAAFGIAGSALGAALAGNISPGVLRQIFAALTVAVGANEIFAALKR